MRRHTISEAVFVMVSIALVDVGCAMDTYINARKGAWEYFWFCLFGTVFLSAILGWLLIDAFNQYQRRRRAQKG